MQFNVNSVYCAGTNMYIPLDIICFSVIFHDKVTAFLVYQRELSISIGKDAQAF